MAIETDENSCDEKYLKDDLTKESIKLNNCEKREELPLLTTTEVDGFHKDISDIRDGLIWSKKKTANNSITFDTFNSTINVHYIPWDISPPVLVHFSDEECTYSTPFLKAVYEGDLSRIKTLIEKLQWLEVEEGFHIACIRGHNEVVEYFLERNLDIHAKNRRYGLDSLSLAVYFNRGTVVRTLLGASKFFTSKLADLHVLIEDYPVPLLHLASFYGCDSALEALLTISGIRMDTNEKDCESWRPIHYAASQGHLNIVQLLLNHQADPNSDGRFDVRPLHVAAYKGHLDILNLLLDHKADPTKTVSLNFPSFPLTSPKGIQNDRSSIMFPPVVTFNGQKYSTLLHWAVEECPLEVVTKLVDCGSSVNSRNLSSITPLGAALTTGRRDIICYFVDLGVRLEDEDKNWRRIGDEESGINVIDILEETNLDSLDCSNREGFSLLHLASSRGFLTLMTRLLNKKVNPDLETVRGETPLFFSVVFNHQACMQRLIESGASIIHINIHNSSVLHAAAKSNNFFAVDAFLKMIVEGSTLDINMTDENGFTAIYYAINAGRYDIVQRFISFCVSQSIHVKATRTETLLQFYTERNIYGQYDNAIVRVLELEKALHRTNVTAEKCIRMQLGTTEASTKAREQLQAMYESTKVQLHCWNLWIVITCFFLPSILFFLDIYTDVLLAVEYFEDYLRNDNSTGSPDQKPIDIIFNISESQSKMNFFLTAFFIIVPMAILNFWNMYVHINQQDVHPLFRKMNAVQRGVLYILIFLLPIAPVVNYIENSYAQIKYMFISSEISEERLEEDRNVSHHMRERLRKHYNLKHVSQMRVAISNVLEASLESAFQLVLQLYILGTQYSALKSLHIGEVTLGSILSLAPTEDSKSRLSKQTLSVIISLISLTWSFTAYHRFSKLGGLKLLWSLPLLFAIFFQVISRAIACTVFTLAHSWKIFIVLAVHFLVVLVSKIFLEKKSETRHRVKTGFFSCIPFFDPLRSYFYVILGTFTSTFVYFRIQRPLVDKDVLSQRHSTFTIQILFLLVVFLENVIIFSLGIAYLDTKDFDSNFQIISGILCLVSFIIGVILQYLYYGCFGHPWVNVNGPNFTQTRDGNYQLKFYKEGGQTQFTWRSCCSGCTENFIKEEDNVYMPNSTSRSTSIVDGRMIPRSGSRIKVR